VHDAFGHGLEGSGFRARGEENAWQAHVRLFTGSAVGAITSETRGQNSWLNYGPNGETNRTAKVEDTVFADQKTGLMPAWTWSEGVVGDFDSEIRKSPARRNDVLAAKMSKIGVGSSYDFWRVWRQVMVATAGPNTALSAMGSKDTRIQSIDRLIDSHRNDARKNGIRSVLNSYASSADGRKGEGENGMVGSVVAGRILKSAGITPTLKNAIAAYEALEYSRRESANDEVNFGQQRTMPPESEGLRLQSAAYLRS
jgi:hypothetical protein